MYKLLLSILMLVVSPICFGQNYKIVNNEIAITEPVLFKPGTAELLPQSEDVLKGIKLFLEAKAYISLLRVEGHSANETSGAANQELSEKRALAVAQWLQTAGVGCKRLLPVGFGNTKPVIAEATADDRSKNSRIIFAVAALNGRAIGGLPVNGGGQEINFPCQ